MSYSPSMPEIHIYQPCPSEAAVLAPIISAWTMESAKRGEAVLPQSVDTLYSQIAHGLSLMAMLDGQPAGHITAYPLDDQYYEVGTLYSHHRNLGIGHKLCQSIAAILPESYLVATTKNPVAVNIFEAQNFIKTPYPEIPVSARRPLCYFASCFVQNGSPGSCVKEHNLGGNCYAYVRPPLA